MDGTFAEMTETYRMYTYLVPTPPNTCLFFLFLCFLPSFAPRLLYSSELVSGAKGFLIDSPKLLLKEKISGNILPFSFCDNWISEKSSSNGRYVEFKEEIFKWFKDNKDNILSEKRMKQTLYLVLFIFDQRLGAVHSQHWLKYE